MSRQGQDISRATNNQHGQKHGRVGGPIRSGNRARQGGSGATETPAQPARTDREPAPAPVHTVGSWANIVKNGPSNEGANSGAQPDNNQAEPVNQPPSELFRSGELAFGSFDDEMNTEERQTSAPPAEKPQPAPPAQPAPPPAAQATAAAPPPPPARPVPAASPKRTGTNAATGQIVGNPHLGPAATAAGGSHAMPHAQHQQQGNTAGQIPHHPAHQGGQHMHHGNHGNHGGHPHASGNPHRKGGAVWAPRGGPQGPNEGPHGSHGSHAAAGQAHNEAQGHRGGGPGSRGAGGYAAVGGAAGQGHPAGGGKVAGQAAGGIGPAGLAAAAAAGSGAYSQQQYAAMQQGQMPVPMGMMYPMPAYGYMYSTGTYAAPVMGYQYMAGYPQGQYPAAGYVQQPGAAVPGQPGGQQQQMPPQQQQQQHPAQHQPHTPQQQQPAPPQQQQQGHQQQYAQAGGASHSRIQQHGPQQPGHSSTSTGPSPGQQQAPHGQGTAGAAGGHASSHSTPVAPASVASPIHTHTAPHLGAKGGHAAAATAPAHGGASPSMVKPPAKKIITIVDPKTQMQVKVDSKASSSGKASPVPAAPPAAVPAAAAAAAAATPVVSAAAAAAGTAALPITPPRLATPPGKAGSAAIPIVPPQPRQPKPPAAAKPSVEEAAKVAAEPTAAEPAAQPAATAAKPAAEPVAAAVAQEPGKEAAEGKESQAAVQEAAEPADKIESEAAATAADSKASEAAAVETSASTADDAQAAADEAKDKKADAGADSPAGEVKEQQPAKPTAAAPAESNEPAAAAAAAKVESPEAESAASVQQTEPAAEVAAAGADGDTSAAAQPEQPAAQPEQPAASAEQPAAEQPEAAAEQPEAAAEQPEAAEPSQPASAADLKKQPSWSEMAKSAASKPVSKPVPVSRTPSTDAGVAAPAAPAAAKPPVAASNGPSKADAKPAAAAAVSKDAAPAANPAPAKSKKGKKGYEDKLSSDMYDTFRPSQPAPAAAEAAGATEPAAATEQPAEKVPEQPAEEVPERTESNADESWEDKAEKDEPAAPKAADAAEANSTPFSADSTEDDGRKRYTLDFLKKHREANKERPDGLHDGEWVGNPAEAAAGSGGGYGGGFDRMGSRRGSRSQGIDRMDSDWGSGGGGGRRGPQGGVGRDGGGFRDARDARGVADRAMRGVMDGGRQGSTRAGADGDMWARGRPLPPARGGNLGGGIRGAAVPNLPALHKTESAFKVGVTRTDDPEEEAKQKAFKGILNKLTPDNFERLSQQLLDVGITEAKTLVGLIAQVFDKALFEPHFCELYSELCYVLQKKLPEFDDPESPQEEGKPKRKLNFRRLLLNKCQEEFEKGDAAMNAVAEREAKKAQGEDDKDDDDGKEEKAAEESDQPEQQLEEGEIPASPKGEKQKKEAAAAAKLEKRRAEAQAEQEELKARRRALGNIQYIGQLYRFGMLTENIMHSCIKRLLQDDKNPRAEDIECLCKLLSTVGQQLESPKVKGRAGMTHTQVQEMQRDAEQGAKRMMDVYFERIKRLSQSDKLESRLRFMLMDVMEQRDRRWETRRKKEGPKRIEEVHREAQQEAANIARRDERGGRGGLDRMGSGRGDRMGGFGGGSSDSRGGGAQGPGLLRREEMLGAPIRASLGHRTASEELSFRPQMGRSPMRGAGGAGGLGAAGGRPSGLREESRQPPPPSRGERVSDSSADAGGRPPLPPSAGSSGGASAGGAGDTSLADVVAAGKNYDGAVKGKAAELAGVLLKVRQPEEEDLTVLEQLLSQSPAPAVGLVALLKEGLDVRGVDVEKRLAGLQPFLTAQLTSTEATLITKSDMSTALLALIGILPDLVEDVPKAPVLVAEVIGHFMAAGLLTFSLLEMAKAVKEAGAEDGAAGEDEESMDPPLIDSEKALPMLLIVANSIKAASGEAAAKSAWSAAAIDMASLLPSFSREDAGEVDKVLGKYDALYLK